MVFTNRSHSYADPILNSIDPGIQSNQGPMVMYRLYKNSTQWRVRHLHEFCRVCLFGCWGFPLCFFFFFFFFFLQLL